MVVRIPALLVAALLLSIWSSAADALDTVTRKSTERRAAGEVTSVTKTEVTVTPKVGSPTTIPANDIVLIEWDGEPASLGLARAKENSGQFALAIADYEKALQEAPAGKTHLKADIEFGIASSTARLGLVDPAQQEAAITRLNGYLETHRDHYQHFNALLLLGQTFLAGEDYDRAEEAFQRVTTAPWPDVQMSANIALGRTALARGNISAARAAFENVANASPTTPTESARRLEGMLGLATCLQREQKHEEAAETLAQVVLESAPEDTRLQAEAYVRLGDCYAALSGRAKDAVMAYLHVEVIPTLAAHKDLHAEVLYQLVQLWPQVGHPERADSAASKLQSLYPNSLWTKKLSGG